MAPQAKAPSLALETSDDPSFCYGVPIALLSLLQRGWNASSRAATALAPASLMVYNGLMKIDLSEDLEMIAKDARAIRPCRECGDYDISMGDDEADEKAHAMAQAAFKAGRFSSTSATDVRTQMAAVLQNAHIDCPQCE